MESISNIIDVTHTYAHNVKRSQCSNELGDMITDPPHTHNSRKSKWSNDHSDITTHIHAHKNTINTQITTYTSRKKRGERERTRAYVDRRKLCFLVGPHTIMPCSSSVWYTFKKNATISHSSKLCKFTCHERKHTKTYIRSVWFKEDNVHDYTCCSKTVRYWNFRNATVFRSVLTSMPCFCTTCKIRWCKSAWKGISSHREVCNFE